MWLISKRSNCFTKKEDLDGRRNDVPQGSRGVVWWRYAQVIMRDSGVQALAPDSLQREWGQAAVDNNQVSQLHNQRGDFAQSNGGKERFFNGRLICFDQHYPSANLHSRKENRLSGNTNVNLLWKTRSLSHHSPENIWIESENRIPPVPVRSK